MNVLIIGQGGREHALAKGFKNSNSIEAVYVIPGNDGMEQDSICQSLDPHNHLQIIDFCKKNKIDFVFIGSEEFLVKGLADSLRKNEILVVGPNSEGANLEGSKIYAKSFMAEANIPTSPYSIVTSLEETMKCANNFNPPYILKADGLAAGKGVFICKNLEELQQSARELFIDKKLGSAGNKALLEQFIPGWELSFLVLTNGHGYTCLPIAQDHKRLKDGDEGPNTGGMGTIAPLLIDEDLLTKIKSSIIQPTIDLIHKKGLLYRGILFFGLMVNENNPFVIEYNVRLGDPETQVILPLIENDLGELFKNLSEGKLISLQIKNRMSCCVVMAAENYPLSPKKGTLIQGSLFEEHPLSYFIHAGTKKDEFGRWIVNGGRVLCSIGLGASYSEAIQNSYNQVNRVKWEGLQFRKDIGKGLKPKS